MFVLPVTRSFSSTRRPAPAPAFSHVFSHAMAGVEGDEATRTPAMDVKETDDAYTVVFDVPGATREGLAVTVEGRRVVLTTEAAAQPEAAPEAPADDAVEPTKPAEKLLYRERSQKAYRRTVVLPAEVDQGSSQARFDNGVLTLSLAKKVSAAAARMTIG